jgi:hypothetical protein
MYGFEDRLLHSLASGRDMLSANHWKQKFFPVHVIDVGRALETMAYDDNTASQTFELYGPREYTKEQVAHLIHRMTLKEKPRINLPKAVAKPLAAALNKLWWPTYCADDIEREFIDQQIDPAAKTFLDLGITPSELDDMAFQYIRDYRYDTLPAALPVHLLTPEKLQQILRLASYDGEGKEGREEVHACYRGHVNSAVLNSRTSFLPKSIDVLYTNISSGRCWDHIRNQCCRMWLG